MSVIQAVGRAVNDPHESAETSASARQTAGRHHFQNSNLLSEMSHATYLLASDLLP